MKNQHAQQIEAPAINANKSNGLEDCVMASLTLGVIAIGLAILCLGCFNTANELITVVFE